MNTILFFLALMIVSNMTCKVARESHLSEQGTLMPHVTNPTLLPTLANQQSVSQNVSSSVASAAVSVKMLDDSSPTVKETVDAIMKPYLLKENLAGAIVAVSLRGERYFFSYGSATASPHLRLIRLSKSDPIPKYLRPRYLLLQLIVIRFTQMYRYKIICQRVIP